METKALESEPLKSVLVEFHRLIETSMDTIASPDEVYMALVTLVEYNRLLMAKHGVKPETLAMIDDAGRNLAIYILGFDENREAKAS